jgi:hypothetical protein
MLSVNDGTRRGDHVRIYDQETLEYFNSEDKAIIKTGHLPTFTEISFLPYSHSLH